jgi:hypothetical protein
VLSPPIMGQLGAELIVVRPDQVVAAVWPRPGPVGADQAVAVGRPDETGLPDPTGLLDPAELLDTAEFLDTTMAMLCGRQGADTTWTRSH